MLYLLHYLARILSVLSFCRSYAHYHSLFEYIYASSLLRLEKGVIKIVHCLFLLQPYVVLLCIGP